MILRLYRSGSFPLMNLAEDYDVPVDLVWQAASIIKEATLNNEPPVIPNDLYRVLKIKLQNDYSRFMTALGRVMIDFVRLQGSKVDG